MFIIIWENVCAVPKGFHPFMYKLFRTACKAFPCFGWKECEAGLEAQHLSGSMGSFLSHHGAVERERGAQRIWLSTRTAFPRSCVTLRPSWKSWALFRQKQIKHNKSLTSAAAEGKNRPKTDGAVHTGQAKCTTTATTNIAQLIYKTWIHAAHRLPFPTLTWIVSARQIRARGSHIWYDLCKRAIFSKRSH